MLLVLWSGIAHGAAPDEVPQGIAERITQAESAFRVQNYPRVVLLLDPLVGHPKLEGRPEHIKVLEWLGAAHWFTNARDAARLVFGQLLKDSPFHKLDAFVYPGELIEFFEARRRELIDANVIPAKPDATPDPVGPRTMLIRTVTNTRQPTVLYLAPFGVGQFMNDEVGKGATFAALQGLGVVTMGAMHLLIGGLETNDAGQILASNEGEAKLLNAFWYAGLGLFVASWAFSIVDGFANRVTEPIIEERMERLPPRDRDGGPASPSVDFDPDLLPDPPRLHLGPGPGQVGVGLGVSF